MKIIQINYILRVAVVIVIAVFVVSSCNTNLPRENTFEPLEIPTPEPVTLVTTESTISKLIEDLSSPNAEDRINAAYYLKLMGADAELAIPALIDNLNYQGVFEVRMAAVEALGAIGPPAKIAVPDLVSLLQTDFVHVQREAATALGQINSLVAVPYLAEALYDDDKGTAINAAKSLGIITGQDFPEMYSVGATLDDNGIPIVVVAAREWWIMHGQHKDWQDS